MSLCAPKHNPIMPDKLLLLICILFLSILPIVNANLKSICGDPSMQSGHVRVALEGWNFCNLAGDYVQGPAPRYADCWDDSELGPGPGGNLITENANRLAFPNPIPGCPNETLTNIDLYTECKELYLGTKCSVTNEKWYFWMIMLKNGNFRERLHQCKKMGKSQSIGYGVDGPMNQPNVFHNWTTKLNPNEAVGVFYGSYDLDVERREIDNLLSMRTVSTDSMTSLFSSTWTINLHTKETRFNHYVRGGSKYPYIMLYHRADLSMGPSGGQPWTGNGILAELPSKGAEMNVFVNITKCTAENAQFYLPESGGCWKNENLPCDGDFDNDVTRYMCFIVNPDLKPHCTADNIKNCPPFHTFINGTVVSAHDRDHFPYHCYYYWCGPPNSPDIGKEQKCDPYSNPSPQEIIQLLPCSEWKHHGFPSELGEGWIGDPRTWQLHVGDLRDRLYFTLDNGTHLPSDAWQSLEIGPEFNQEGGEVEWELTNWDVLKPQ